MLEGLRRLLPGTFCLIDLQRALEEDQKARDPTPMGDVCAQAACRAKSVSQGSWPLLTRQ